MSEENDKLAQDAEFPDTDIADSGGAAMSIEQKKTGRLPLLLALLALLISAVSLLAVGWMFFMHDNPAEPAVVDDSALVALSSTVEATQRSVGDLASRLDVLADSDLVSRAELGRIERQLEQNLQQYVSLPDRIANVENTMSSIQGIATGVRDRWLLAEAEYYMQIANAQLQLAANPHLAKLALLQADERVQQLANPALTHVRRAMADELRSLDLVTRPDIAGITLALASLADAVDALPLRTDVVRVDSEDTVSAEDLSGFDRAVQSLKSTMTDVVSVRRTDEAVRPLIAPEAAYFLRANLSLQLQAARLALLRTETAVYQRSLDDADAWLAEYYDTAAPEVKTTRQSIADLRGRLHDIKKPDISESLRLLRQFNALRTAPQRDAAAENSAISEPAGPAAQSEDTTPAADDGNDQ